MNMKVTVVGRFVPIEVAERVRDLFGRSTRLVSSGTDFVILKSLTLPFNDEDAVMVSRQPDLTAKIVPNTA